MSKHALILRLMAAALLAVLLASSLRAQEKVVTVSAEPTIHIDNFTFTPAEITVSPGTTVVWTNGDDIPHTVVATNKAFRSKVLDTDQQYSFTFKEPGTYEYFCSLHPHMKGKVVVR